MKAKKVVFGFAVLLATMALTSCTNESTANEDQLYEQQAIDKDEITEDDT